MNPKLRHAIGKFTDGIVFAGGVLFLIAAVGIAQATLSGNMGGTVSNGAPLSSSAWNAIVSNVTDLDKRTEALVSTGGKVGIGTPSPSSKLEVAGDVKVSGTLRAAQPAFSAYATSTVVGANTAIAFAGVTTNIGNAYNPANGRFTAPVTGTYFITARGLSDPSTNILQLRIYVNGADVPGLTSYSQVSAGEYGHQTVSGVLSLNAGDYVTVGMLAGSMHGGPNYNSGFSGFLIGG